MGQIANFTSYTCVRPGLCIYWS